MKIYSIREVNTKISDAVEQLFEDAILIKGELQPPKKYSNGSQYCQLLEKSDDKQYQIACVILGWENFSGIELQEYSGQEVIVTGKVDFYDGSGRLQVKINNIEIFGEGALRQRIEQLKKKLAQDGVFDNMREIPLYPENIGVITSEQGAVIHDVQSAINRRFPISNILLYPSIVQGESASKSLVKQIQKANEDNISNVILIVRGGGSFFDLMPFNDETLIRAISNSRIPVVTGIGHEPDITLADYASDKSTPTPTAAAEYVTPNIDDIINSINIFTSSLLDKCANRIKEYNNQTDNGLLLIKQFNPKQIIKNNIEERKRLEKILRITLKAKIDEIYYKLEVSKLRLSSNSRNLNQAIRLFKKSVLDSKKNMIEKRKSLLKRKASDINNMIKMISSYNPSLNLKRGFSIIRSKDSKIIKSTSSFKSKTVDSIQFSDGMITVKNIEIE
tara:strand:- start:8271 stop:9611 length:1341 start_codon:yes stop_codon:yes gene_type:complete